MIQQFLAAHTPFKQFLDFLALANRKATFDPTGTQAISMVFSFLDRLSFMDRVLIQWYMQKYHRNDSWIFTAWREHRRNQCGAS